MENLRKFVRKTILESLDENLQQAQKLYFNNNKLPKNYQDYILNLTGGNAFTKLVSDIAYHFGKPEFNERNFAFFDLFYKYLTNYDKKVVPLPFELNEYGADENTDNDHHVLTLYECLSEIYYLREQMNKLPSLILRNIRKELNKSYTDRYGYKIIAEKLKILNNNLRFLPKNNEEKRNMVLNKIASSNQNLDQMVKVSEHFANSFNYATAEMDVDDFLDAMKYVDVEIVQKISDILVIKVNSSEAMETVGCNSLWCFARPNSENFWDDYAINGYVYVILNFKKEPDEAEFMLTYLPESDQIYNSMNVYIEDSGLDYLQNIGVDIKKMKVPEEVYSESFKMLKKLIRETVKKMSLTESIHVFRGGAKQYDEFNMDKIGTGDGRSLGGWGIYCSDSELVAQRYFLKGGVVKEFDISDGDYFDFDENLEAGEQILQELKSINISESNLEQFQTDYLDYANDTTNKQVYEWLSYVLGNEKNASLFLESIGYKGNKFKDKVETDATNYVLFSPKYIRNNF